MKLYKNLSLAVVEILQSIFEDNKYADKAIEKAFKANPRWGSRDRRFIAETTYDIVRWYRWLQEIASAKKGDYWSLLAGWLIWKNIDLPDWDEFKNLNITAFKQNLEKEYPLAVKQSIPDWMNLAGEQEIGEHWEKELKSLNQEADVVLRVNTLKITKKELASRLEGEGVDTHAIEGFRDAVALRSRQNVFGTESFKEGLFEVQDAGSQLIAPFLQVEPGMRIVDACAGAGGKTLHLAALLQNKGRIIALDTEDWKLTELKKRARRAGATNIEIRVIDSSKTIKRLVHSADRLLLDVPCSGLGVLKRNPDAKWKLNEDYLEKVKEVQRKILSEYSVMVKPGGLIVYATCSILPSENEEQVRQFILNNPDGFELIGDRHAWPSEGFDGFYMALIKKKL